MSGKAVEVIRTTLKGSAAKYFLAGFGEKMAAAPADPVDSPVYAAWAGFKSGAILTFNQISTPAGATVPATITLRLVNIKPDGVMLEVTLTPARAGIPQPTPKLTIIPAKVEKGREYVPPGIAADAKIENEKDGAETLTFKDAKIETVVHAFTATLPVPKGSTSPAVSTTFKIWSSREVPGGVIKTDQTLATPSGNIVITSTLTDYTLPK